MILKSHLIKPTSDVYLLKFLTNCCHIYSKFGLLLLEAVEFYYVFHTMHSLNAYHIINPGWDVYSTGVTGQSSHSSQQGGAGNKETDNYNLMG